jgi:hypothetical protein
MLFWRVGKSRGTDLKLSVQIPKLSLPHTTVGLRKPGCPEDRHRLFSVLKDFSELSYIQLLNTNA